ncbi:MAG: DNA modification methylase [Chloroflexi bacterium]|nr:DNA modification methylase [Chloroflexota bacterium]
MNDLSYTDWMKFQKSFFRYQSSTQLARECIEFFTKARWPDGSPSSTLVVGWDYCGQDSPRIIDSYPVIYSMAQLIKTLETLKEAGRKYDFILIDLRNLISNVGTLETFLRTHADVLFSLLRLLLRQDKYCGLALGTDNEGSSFPLPWAVADFGRSYLRLCDEKIGLLEPNNLFYLGFLRNKTDERPPIPISPAELHLSAGNATIPAWTVPKPPPRKKNEMLHPAKFPETLITSFIERFTNPGDRVFDPMVGTGTTVVAAIRSKRQGYGVELSPEFVQIAQNRLLAETCPRLFSESVAPLTTLVVRGDATGLEEIAELRNVTFDYIVTSPPYWSMLSNPGSEGQRARKLKNLPLVYSQNDRDLGNVRDYDRFLQILTEIYNGLSAKLVNDGILTVVVKNIKRNHIVYSLAWDLTARLCGPSGNYEFVGNTFWCQDDVGIKPFAVGIHWVSNTLHQYCLHYKKRPRP